MHEPAFPTVWKNTGDSNAIGPGGEVVPPGRVELVPGMSLRDYFAAKALAGLLADPNSCGEGVPADDPECDQKVQQQRLDLARCCYLFADAMLKARKEELCASQSLKLSSTEGSSRQNTLARMS